MRRILVQSVWPLVFFACLSSGMCHGGIISYGFGGLGHSLNEVSVPVFVPKFDLAFGTLTQVRGHYSYSGSAVTNYSQFVSEVPLPGTYSFSYATFLTFQSSALHAGYPQFADAYGATGPIPVFVPYAGAGIASATSTYGGTASGVVGFHADFTAGLSPGSYVADMQVVLISRGAVDGGYGSSIHSGGPFQFSGQLTYEYDPVAGPGDSQSNPILPTSGGVGTGYTFTGVDRGRWFDPNSAYGYEYEMIGGSLFTRILSLPTGFSDPFKVIVDNMSLGLFSGGDAVDFGLLPGGGASKFRIEGINALVDGQNPTAFPIQLDFNTPTVSFRLRPLSDTAVPEASTWAMCVVVAAVFGWARRVWDGSTPAQPM